MSNPTPYRLSHMRRLLFESINVNAYHIDAKERRTTMFNTTTKPLLHMYIIKYMIGTEQDMFYTYSLEEYKEAQHYLGALYFILDYYRADITRPHASRIPRLEDRLIDRNDIRFSNEDHDDFINYFEYYLDNLDK